MDLSKIPKFVIWGAIAVFIVSILITLYSIISYKITKPYQNYFEVECVYSNETSIIILTAKKDIDNITIHDFEKTNYCNIENLKSGSMDACKIQNKLIGNQALVRIYYSFDNESYSAIITCKISERKSIFDIFRR